MNVDPSLLQRLGRLEFLARQAVEGFITGLHKSPFHGFSVEFAEHRLYNPGESTRHIDWKLYGRTDKLFVKRYEEETNLRCQLVLDCSGSMWYPSEVSPDGPKLNKLKFAIHSCAALIELFRRQRDAVGLSVFADELESHIPAKSSGAHMRMIYHELEQLLDDWIRPELLQRPVFGVFDLLTKVLGQGLFELQRIAVVLEIEGLVQFSRQCLAFSGGSLLGGDGSGNVYCKASDLAIGAGADH